MNETNLPDTDNPSEEIFPGVYAAASNQGHAMHQRLRREASARASLRRTALILTNEIRMAWVLFAILLLLTGMLGYFNAWTSASISLVMCLWPVWMIVSKSDRRKALLKQIGGRK